MMMDVIANQSTDWCGNLHSIWGFLNQEGDSHASVSTGSE